MSVNNEKSDARYIAQPVDAHAAVPDSNTRVTNAMEAEARQIWQVALHDLYNQLGRNEYDAWIKNLSLVRLNQGVAMITAPTSYACQRLENNYSRSSQPGICRRW